MFKALILTLILLPLSANALVITTTFAGGNGADGNMFDIEIGSNDVTVTAFDLNLNAVALDLEFYYKTGSYVGSENDASAWTFVDATSLTGAGEGSPTFWNILDLNLSASTVYSFYITETDLANSGGDFRYTNGAAGSIIADNADLTVYGGIGNNYAFSSVFNNRHFNGNIYYDVVSSDVPAPATLALLGLGLIGLRLGRKR
jgi:hypothetical protein